MPRRHSSTPIADDEPARQALRCAAQALDDAEAQRQPLPMSQALRDMAHCYTALGQHGSAELLLVEALRWSRGAGSNDLLVDLLCAACEAAARVADAHDADAQPHLGHGHAARERARDHAFEASTLASHVADAGWEVEVLLRISDVLDRCGDRDDAALLQTRALRLMAGALCAPHDPTLLPGLGRLADV